MSDETSKTEITETESADVTESEGLEVEAKSDDEKSEDEDDDDDDDDDEKDDEKKSKAKINFEATLPRTEAVSYFEAIVGGLRSGRLEFRQEGDTLVFNVPDRVEVEVEAALKGDKGKIVFEIEWSKKTRGLDISS